METLLASRIPNLISQNTVFQAAFLRKEGSSNRRLLVRLEFIRDLRTAELRKNARDRALETTHETQHN